MPKISTPKETIYKKWQKSSSHDPSFEELSCAYISPRFLGKSSAVLTTAYISN